MSGDPTSGDSSGIGEAISEEDIRRLVAAYQQYQNQADAIVRQISLTQLTAEGLDRASKAVEALGTANEGQEMLVPIGSGSFVYAKLVSKDKVVLNVGAGVSIEKTAAEAKESLKVRQTEVSEGSKKLSEMLTRIDQEMQKIQAILARYEQEAQGSGQRVV
ncbi:MAG: prefoldin subunit alpha [Methanotrichaceae archaeon]